MVGIRATRHLWQWELKSYSNRLLQALSSKKMPTYTQHNGKTYKIENGEVREISGQQFTPSYRETPVYGSLAETAKLGTPFNFTSGQNQTTTPKSEPVAIVSPRKAEEQYQSDFSYLQSQLETENLRNEALALGEKPPEEKPLTRTFDDLVNEARQFAQAGFNDPNELAKQLGISPEQAYQILTTNIGVANVSKPREEGTPDTSYEDSLIASTEQKVKNLQARLNAQEAQMIQVINDSFNKQIKEMKELNAATEAGLTRAGIRAGRSRYAPEQEIVALAEANAKGIQRITDLENKRQSKILEAQTAATEKEIELLFKSVGELRQLNKDKQQAIKDHQANILALEKETREMAKSKLETLKLEQDIEEQDIGSVAELALSFLTDNEEDDVKQIQDLADRYNIDPQKLINKALELDRKNKAWSEPYELPGIGTVQSNVQTGEIRTIKPTTTVTGGRPRISYQNIGGQVTQLITDELGNIISSTQLGAGAAASGIEAVKTRENANSGLRALKTIKSELYDTNGNLKTEVLQKAALPGSLFARKYETAVREASDVLTRLRTGAALNENEEKFYRSQLPTLLDLTDPEAIDYKLKVIEDLFNALAQYGQGVSGGLGNMGSTPPIAGGQSAQDLLNKYGIQ